MKKVKEALAFTPGPKSIGQEEAVAAAAVALAILVLIVELLETAAATAAAPVDVALCPDSDVVPASPRRTTRA